MDVLAETYADRQHRFEDAFLSPVAVRSYPAQRRREEADSPLRTPFQRDRDRIVHSKSFRRLKHKTQVFVAPEGDHYRTRLTHTLEVTQVSRTVARALGLNEDLTEAIGLGHDLGHPPFGHIGEEALDGCLRARFPGHPGFRHYEHSLRIVDTLEPLNLTDPVREGILRHSSRIAPAASLEARIVRVVDRVAYINHDIDDALRAGVLDAADLPLEALAILGPTGSARIGTLVEDLVACSERAGDIVQGPEAGGAMDALRSFMFAHVYLGPAARQEHAKIHNVIATLFAHHCDLRPEDTDGRVVTDYLAGMTDRFCLRAFEDLVVPDAFAP